MEAFFASTLFFVLPWPTGQGPTINEMRFLSSALVIYRRWNSLKERAEKIKVEIFFFATAENKIKVEIISL